MIVMILEKVSVGLRGELSRWLIEPRTGVFVGQVSARKAWGAASDLVEIDFGT